jgi:hypothetical protein
MNARAFVWVWMERVTPKTPPILKNDNRFVTVWTGH